MRSSSSASFIVVVCELCFAATKQCPMFEIEREGALASLRSVVVLAQAVGWQVYTLQCKRAVEARRMFGRVCPKPPRP